MAHSYRACRVAAIGRIARVSRMSAACLWLMDNIAALTELHWVEIVAIEVSRLVPENPAHGNKLPFLLQSCPVATKVRLTT